MSRASALPTSPAAPSDSELSAREQAIVKALVAAILTGLRAGQNSHEQLAGKVGGPR